MRHSAHSPLATVLLMIPIMTIPLLAIVGVPQITPVVPTALETQEKGPDQEPEFKPLPAQEWDALSEISTRVTHEAPSEWQDMPLDPSAQAVVQRRAKQAPVDPHALPAAEGAREHGSPSTAVVDSSPRFPAVDSLSNPPSRHAAVGSAEAVSNLAYIREVPLDHRSALAIAQNRTQPSADSAPLSWQSAVRKLNELEIRNFRLEPGQTPERFVFICSYTPPDNPRVSYRFEAEADEPLRAVEKVLAQIDTWLSSR